MGLPRDNLVGLKHETLLAVIDYDRATGVFSWPKKINQVIGPAGSVNHETGYRIIVVRGHKYMAHRLAWFYVHGKWPEKRLDHINGDRSDNRIKNLREATDQQNVFNRKNYKLKFHHLPKGVEAHVSGKYRSRIYWDGRSRHLGLFDTPEEAHAAYMAKAVELHGEFVRAG